ncbi:hypothetical protein D3C87_894940 [compost metagenome]
MKSSPAIKEKKESLLDAAKGALRKRLPRKTPQLVELFDAAWYLKGLPDRALIANPWEHYLGGGFLRGNPNPMFDTTWYLDRHPELRAAEKNPLAHYLEIGERAGDAPSVRFDPQWYLDEYPDVAATQLSPLLHYLKFGAAEGRLPARLAHFDSVPALSEFMGALAPSYAARPCSIDLPVGSVFSVASQAGGAGRVLHRVAPGFCEGLDGPPDYPKVGFVAEINDTTAIAGTRYLIGPTNFVLHDENAHFLCREDAAIKYGKARRSAAPGHLHIEVNARQAAWIERGFHIMHEYENNYFHFIAETLPRMLLAEEADVPLNVPFLCTEGLHPNIAKLLELANLEQRPVILLESGTLYRVKQMYYPSDMTSVVDAYHGGEMARQTGLDVNRIRAGVERCQRAFATKDFSRGRKIFAARNGSYRKLLNQREIEARVEKLGFEVVHTDELDLEAQIRAFQDAEVIVGPTGAQMTNMVWCKPGAKVVVLASDHPSHQLYFWELLGRVSGAKVKIVQGPRAHVRDDIYSVHDDYHVDEDAVIAAISDEE